MRQCLCAALTGYSQEHLTDPSEEIRVLPSELGLSDKEKGGLELALHEVC